ncbi:hypothetical protein HanIR_Chr04g0153841 [Helianthus annuus]|nr:hypothetical protein HanIR_Chr04g0153841 [Helianthus annuus]
MDDHHHSHPTLSPTGLFLAGTLKRLLHHRRRKRKAQAGKLVPGRSPRFDTAATQKRLLHHRRCYWVWRQSFEPPP